MVASCKALVKNVVGLGVEEEDRERTWLADAEVGPGALGVCVVVAVGAACGGWAGLSCCL
jgi:hypothetical protein